MPWFHRWLHWSARYRFIFVPSDHIRRPILAIFARSQHLPLGAQHCPLLRVAYFHLHGLGQNETTSVPNLYYLRGGERHLGQSRPLDPARWILG